MRHLLVIAVVLAAGCKKPSVGELRQLEAEACRCKDAACSRQIEKRLTDLLGDASPSELGKEAMAVSMHIAVCLGKARAELGPGSASPGSGSGSGSGSGAGSGSS